MKIIYGVSLLLFLWRLALPLQVYGEVAHAPEKRPVDETPSVCKWAAYEKELRKECISDKLDEINVNRAIRKLLNDGCLRETRPAPSELFESLRSYARMTLYPGDLDLNSAETKLAQKDYFEAQIMSNLFFKIRMYLKWKLFNDDNTVIDNLKNEILVASNTVSNLYYRKILTRLHRMLLTKKQVDSFMSSSLKINVPVFPNFSDNLDSTQVPTRRIATLNICSLVTLDFSTNEYNMIDTAFELHCQLFDPLYRGPGNIPISTNNKNLIKHYENQLTKISVQFSGNGLPSPKYYIAVREALMDENFKQGLYGRPALLKFLNDLYPHLFVEHSMASKLPRKAQSYLGSLLIAATEHDEKKQLFVSGSLQQDLHYSLKHNPFTSEQIQRLVHNLVPEPNQIMDELRLKILKDIGRRNYPNAFTPQDLLQWRAVFIRQPSLVLANILAKWLPLDDDEFFNSLKINFASQMGKDEVERTIIPFTILASRGHAKANDIVLEAFQTNPDENFAASRDHIIKVMQYFPHRWNSDHWVYEHRIRPRKNIDIYMKAYDLEESFVIGQLQWLSTIPFDKQPNQSIQELNVLETIAVQIKPSTMVYAAALNSIDHFSGTVESHHTAMSRVNNIMMSMGRQDAAMKSKIQLLPISPTQKAQLLLTSFGGKTFPEALRLLDRQVPELNQKQKAEVLLSTLPYLDLSDDVLKRRMQELFSAYSKFFPKEDDKAREKFLEILRSHGSNMSKIVTLTDPTQKRIFDDPDTFLKITDLYPDFFVR